MAGFATLPGDPHWWLGYLAQTIKHNLDQPEPRHLADALERFRASPVCPPALGRRLAEKSRSEEER